MEVEVREEASSASGRIAFGTNTPFVNSTGVYPVTDGPVIIVRVEEVLLVVLVLVIWVAAIALFFNRWGKIRMLEPYQPKFHQQPHRASCPLAPLSPPAISAQQRMSFSKYNVNALTDPLSALPSPIIRRPRQNSVFVGSSAAMAVLSNPPRRTRSAVDIQHLLINEHSPTTSFTGSIIPIVNNRERRPSLLTIERPIFISRHRPSITIDRPPSIAICKSRRSSCFERTTSRHRNFISFEHERKVPPQTISERSSSYQPTTISFDTLVEKPVEIAVSIEEPPTASTSSSKVTFKPIISRSFEQPCCSEKCRPERMATSLDVNASLANFDHYRRPSIPEEEDSNNTTTDDAVSAVSETDIDLKHLSSTSSIYINIEDSRVTAPLLESLKSSDV